MVQSTTTQTIESSPGPDLSMSARGLFLEMLSYPSDRTITAAELAERGRESVQEILDIFDELEAAGLIRQVPS